MCISKEYFLDIYLGSFGEGHSSFHESRGALPFSCDAMKVCSFLKEMLEILLISMFYNCVYIYLLALIRL